MAEGGGGRIKNRLKKYNALIDPSRPNHYLRHPVRPNVDRDMQKASVKGHDIVAGFREAIDEI